MIRAVGDPAAGFTLDSLVPALLVSTIILIVCVAAVRLSTKTGLPSLLIYLAVGLAVGESGPGGIHFESEELTQVLGYAALVLILTEGGLTTRWSTMRGTVGPAVLLSTLGVVVSIGVVAVACRFVLNLDWTTAMLIGAILSSTDAAAVFSVLRNVPLPRRITGMLEAESGFNDAPVVILVTALSVQASNPDAADSIVTLAFIAVWELAGGAAAGLAIGYLGGRFMRQMASSSSALFSIGVMAVAVLAYAAAASVHLSGFIACYLAALVLGNMRMPHRGAVHAFSTAAGWLAQIGLFVLLGLLASPSGFAAQLGPAIVIGLILLLVARPLSVVASVTAFGIPWRDQVFLSWAGLRGAVPVVLATVPRTEQAPNVDWIFDLVFVLVVIFTIVQAPALPKLAVWLGVAESHRARQMSVESTPLEDMGAHMLHVDVGDGSLLHGVAVFELRLPAGSNVTLIVRDGKSFVPSDTTTIRHGDQLLVVTTDESRPAIEQILRDVSRGGRLAGWARTPRPPTPRRRRPGTPGHGTVGGTSKSPE